MHVQPPDKTLTLTALMSFMVLSSASTTVAIASGIHPRQSQGPCTTSLTTSTSTYLVYRPEVFSNPPDVGGPAWSTRTTGTGLYVTRTGTATHPVVYCEPKTSQAPPTTTQAPSTDLITSAPHETVSAVPTTSLVTSKTVSAPPSTATSDSATEPQTVTSIVPPVTVTLRVPERTDSIRIDVQPSSTSSESVTEPAQTHAEAPAQDTINTCAVTLASSATIPPPAPVDPDSELTWGCPPGTNCDPPKPQLCEAWSDSPVDEFTCQVVYCRPVKALRLGSGGGEGKFFKFPLNEGYFDLDPRHFGLGFDIFVKPDDLISKDVHPQSPPQQHNDTKAWNKNEPRPDRARDLLTHLLPAACFETCNNAYLEAQSMGKTTKLCRPDSAFMAYYRGCAACVDRNAEQTTGVLGFITSSSYLSGKFAQFLRFCKVAGDIKVGNSPTVGAWSSSSPAEDGARKTPSSSRPAGAADGAVASPDAGASSHSGAAFAEHKEPAGAWPAALSSSSSSAIAEAGIHGTGQSLELSYYSSTFASAAEDRISGALPTTPARHRPLETPPGAMIFHAEADASSTGANASLASGPRGTVVVTAGSSTWIPDLFGKHGSLLFVIIASIVFV